MNAKTRTALINLLIAGTKEFAKANGYVEKKAKKDKTPISEKEKQIATAINSLISSGWAAPNVRAITTIAETLHGSAIRGISADTRTNIHYVSGLWVIVPLQNRGSHDYTMNQPAIFANDRGAGVAFKQNGTPYTGNTMDGQKSSMRPATVAEINSIPDNVLDYFITNKRVLVVA